MFKQLHFKTMLLLGLMLAGGNLVVNAGEPVTIWTESWDDVDASSLPNVATDFPDVSYAFANGTGSKPGTTKIYDETLAGGESAPELLIGKKGSGTTATGGSLTATLSTLREAAQNFTLTYYSNNNKINLSSNVDGVSFTKNDAKSEGTRYVYDVIVPVGTTSMTIVFTANSTSNVRIDDIVFAGEKADSEDYVDAPTFSQEGGEVYKGTTITLTQDAADYIIYTTNGTEPAFNKATEDIDNGELYASPIAVNADVTIKAIAVKGKNVSPVASFEFTLRPEMDLTGSTTEVSFTGFGDAINSGSYVTTLGATILGSNGTNYSGWNFYACNDGNNGNGGSNIRLRGGDGVVRTPIIKTNYGFKAVITATGTPLKMAAGSEESTTTTLVSTSVYTELVISATGANTVTISSIKITPLAAPSASIGTTGWATYVAENNVTFPSGVTAYIVNATSTTSATLEEVLAVPYGTPVLLNASKGDYALEVVDAEDCDDVSGNLLKVSDGTAKDNIYVLANGANGAGFYVWAGAALKEGRVYLDAPAGARSFISFDAETSTVNSIVENKADNKFYNLNGQRVAAPQKGLYIVNGKKVIIK